MEEMTDRQFQEYKETLLKLVIEKVENSKDVKEAVKKIKDLLENK